MSVSDQLKHRMDILENKEGNLFKFSIDIPVNQLNKIIKWIIGLDILFLIGTWLHHSKLVFQHRHTMNLLLLQFNLGLENVAASWYSSMLLFLIAVMAGLCYLADRQRFDKPKERILNTGWLFIVLAFTMLSFDEMGSFHESIGDSALFKEMGAGKMSGWIVFYIAGGLVAAFMIAFFLMKFKGNKKVLLFAVAGFLLYVSNPFQEKFEHYTWDNSPDPANWHRPAFFLLLEEGSELLASLCFLCSFTIYAIGATARNNTCVSEKRLKLSLIPKRNFIFWMVGLFIVMGLFMLVIYLNAWHLKDDDMGRPQNWFPSVLAFAAFIVSIYQFFKSRKQNNPTTVVYFCIALAALFSSAYFAADIYNYYTGFFTRWPYVLLAVTGLAGIAALAKLSGQWAKIAAAVWIIFMALSVFSKEFFNPPLYGFIAFSFLLMALFLHFKYPGKR